MNRIAPRLAASVLLLLAVAAVPPAASAQGADDAAEPRPAALYAELGGNAVFYSINFEQEIAPGWMGRVGLSVLPLLDEPPVMAAPLLVERLIGDGPNKLELGLGVVPRVRDGRELWWTAAVGFRRLRDNGVIFRATFTPLVESNFDTASAWFGISFGKML